jgi:DNA-binding TFAR19-related protein (PDSD5 family)
MNEKTQDITKNVQALEITVKSRMTKEARERYGRVRMTHPQAAFEALAILAQLIRKNNTQIINDITLKKLLMKIKV